MPYTKLQTLFLINKTTRLIFEGKIGLEPPILSLLEIDGSYSNQKKNADMSKASFVCIACFQW